MRPMPSTDHYRDQPLQYDNNGAVQVQQQTQDEYDHHPLFSQEWLASCILQRFADVGDVQSLCRLSLLNKTFLAASNSDLLWLKLLPPASHLAFLFTRELSDDGDLVQCTSKKALFKRLLQPIALAGGLKMYWLDHQRHGDCYMISASAPEILVGSNVHNWKWLPACPGAWFSKVAFLDYLSFLDIKGKLQMWLRPGSYTVSFRMQILCPSSFGRSSIQLSLQNTTYVHEAIRSHTVIFPQKFQKSSAPPMISLPPPTQDESLLARITNEQQYPFPKRDEWLECDVGAFIVKEDEDTRLVKVEFSIREEEFGLWKNGVLLDGVFVRPNS